MRSDANFDALRLRGNFFFLAFQFLVFLFLAAPRESL